jgi:hypothetical protein
MTDDSRFTSVYVARPGDLWDKHRKYDFGIVVRFLGRTPGFKYPQFEVWVPDTNEVRRAFITDIRKYSSRRRKRKK